ncbi:MAG: hypothetical protein ABSB49_14690 [Polyangia bacterium]
MREHEMRSLVWRLLKTTMLPAAVGIGLAVGDFGCIGATSSDYGAQFPLGGSSGVRVTASGGSVGSGGAPGSGGVTGIFDARASIDAPAFDIGNVNQLDGELDQAGFNRLDGSSSER